MVRLYARSLKGERAQGPKPTKRGKNVSIIGAMSVKEILTSVNLIGGTDAITFEAFIIYQKTRAKTRESGLCSDG